MISKRIGMIVPSLNTIAEDDLRHFLPADIGFHVHRVRLSKSGGRVTQQDLIDAAGEATGLATMLGDAKLDAIAYNCTGATITGGPEGARRLAEEMSGATDGTPATTTALAVVAALRAVGGTRLVHICPFAPEFSQDEAEFLRDSGFGIVTSRGLGFTDARVAAQMSPEEIVETAVPLDSADADAVFLACANVRATEAVEALEARIGKPVVASNQAVLWQLLRMLGRDDRVAGAGSLFGKGLLA
jgi:maleate isomerase